MTFLALGLVEVSSKSILQCLYLPEGTLPDTHKDLVSNPAEDNKSLLGLLKVETSAVDL